MVCGGRGYLTGLPVLLVNLILVSYKYPYDEKQKMSLGTAPLILGLFKRKPKSNQTVTLVHRRLLSEYRRALRETGRRYRMQGMPPRYICPAPKGTRPDEAELPSMSSRLEFQDSFNLAQL